jgi:CTP:molybdopterin cytidylyltransferase MocA
MFASMGVAGIVLAAGPSARIGFPRALLDFHGAPFVVRVLEALEALELKVRVVVLGPDAVRVRPVLAVRDCLVVETAAVDTGPLGSVRTALTALSAVRPAGALVWPVDRPHVRIATVERLLEAYGRGAQGAVVPTFGGRRGQPVLWGPRLIETLGTSPAGSTEQVLAEHRDEVLELPVDDPAVVDAIDTPEDYERLLREASAAGSG